ncbi:hypothetical protein BGW80DRAFT_1383288, partial [Lactifluus volemus]
LRTSSRSCKTLFPMPLHSKVNIIVLFLCARASMICHYGMLRTRSTEANPSKQSRLSREEGPYSGPRCVISVLPLTNFVRSIRLWQRNSRRSTRTSNKLPCPWRLAETWKQRVSK